MARPKISDTERAERVREWSRKASARRRVKLMTSGKEQLLCWIPSTIRQQLDALAAARNLSLSDTVCTLLTSALDTTPAHPRPASPSSVDTLPLFDTALDTSPSLTATERDQQILELHRQGLSGYAIADRVGCSEPTVRRALKKQTKEATV